MDKTPNNWSFKDIVRDPELASRMLAERELDPDTITDDDIHRLIDGLRHDESRHNCAIWLQDLGPRSSAIAISRLNDETLTRLVDSYYFPLKDLIPAVTGRSDQAVLDRLRDLAKDERPHARALAGQVLAETNRDDVVELVIQLLHDQNESVRENVILGLRWYHEEPERSEELIEQLYPHIRTMIGREKFTSGEPAHVLLQLDPKRAAGYLSSPNFGTHASDEGTELVNAFLRLELIPPTTPLEERVRWFASHNDDFSGAYGFSRSLELLGQYAPKLAEPFLEIAMAHPEEMVREVGYDTRCRIAGILPPFDKLYELWQNDPNAPLDVHQSAISAITAIDGEIGNGGFEQYLWNSTADEWPNHRTALESVVAIEHLAILNRVIELFGKDGPPLDREKRHITLANIATYHEDDLDDCDSQWYGLSEKLHRLQVEYALAHPDSFKTDAKQSP